MPQRIDSDCQIVSFKNGYKNHQQVTHAIAVQLSVCADIEKSASSVVGTRYERVTIGEKLDGVDIGLVASECLYGLAGANIPKLGERIASTRHKGVLVCGVQTDAHYVAQVVGELNDLCPRLDIPLHACHIAGGGEDAAVVDETAAREITCMTRKLPVDTSRAVTVRVQVVDGANVVETTAGDEVAARGIGASHNPRRS